MNLNWKHSTFLLGVLLKLRDFHFSGAHSQVTGLSYKKSRDFFIAYKASKNSGKDISNSTVPFLISVNGLV
jgi:hypothetical protein